MKKGNKIVKVLLSLFLIVVLLALGLYFYADSLIVRVVEKAGTDAIGTETKLARANLQVFKGSLGLEGLSIANPAGYKTSYLMEMPQFSSTVDIGSLKTDTVVIREIVIDGMVLTLEQQGTTTNVQTVLDTIAAKNPKEGEPKPAETTGKSGKKVAFDKIEIRNATTRIKLIDALAGEKGLVEVKLGPIVLENIKQDGNKAVMAGAIIQQILVAVTKATIEGNPGQIPQQLLTNLAASTKLAQMGLTNFAVDLGEKAGKALEGVKEVGGKAVEQGTKVLEEGKKAVEEGAKAIEEGGKKVEDALQGLLKKKEEKK